MNNKQYYRPSSDEKLYTRLYFAFVDLYKNLDRPITATFIAKQAGEAFEAITGFEYKPCNIE